LLKAQHHVDLQSETRQAWTDREVGLIGGDGVFERDVHQPLFPVDLRALIETRSGQDIGARLVERLE
jgi:hypothetical protein